mgnify:CR=1 FL=1
MLREFCQVTDFRSIFVYQSMQEKLPPTGTATGSSLRMVWQAASGRFSVLLSVRKYFFPLSGTKRFVKYNVSDGNTF